VSYDTALGYPGEFFYHYTTREAAFEHILPERKLRLSPARCVRDPLESNPALITAAYGELGDPVVEYEQQAVAFEAGIKLLQRRRCSKVLSMTIDASAYEGDAEIFGRGYARARMWEQYAEAHRGVCLMFRREDFERRALAELRARSPNSWASAVNYTQRGILENPAATLMANNNPGTPAARMVDKHVQQQYDWIFFTKLLDWESEHEYRFIESSMDDGYSHVEIGDTLSKIIVGHGFPDWQMPGFYGWCDRIGAQPWRMSWDRSRPSPQRASPP
jgi:hypothetical protein